MKLRTRVISGFLLVTIIPLILMSLLLYVYISASYESLNLKRSDSAVQSFRFFLDSELSELEEQGNRLAGDREFLIRALDLPDRTSDLEALLETRIASGAFQFGLVRLKGAPELVRAYQEGLGDLVRNYSYLPPSGSDHYGLTGLITLSEAAGGVVAAVARVPVHYRGNEVGELMIGRLLEQLVGQYRMELFDLSGLMIVSGERILFARTNQTIARSLTELALLHIGDDLVETQLGNGDFLIRETAIKGLVGEDVAAIKFVFDQSEASENQAKLIRIFLILVACALGFTLVVGLAYSRHLSKPVTEMSAAARQIAARKIPQRIMYFHDDEIGELVGGINRLTDDLKATEQQLRQSERVAAWQMFARQTAHELKNFLMPLATTAGQLQRWAESGVVEREKLNQAVNDIHLEITRMKRLLGAFSEFAKLPPPQLKRVDLNTILADLNSAFAGQLRDGRLSFTIADTTVPLVCDPGQLRQVMLNLLVNSYQAGASTVEVRIEPDGDRLWFEVIDDGRGVAADADPFAPLYSTTADGSGLGLAIVKRIIVDHGGDISYHPNSTGGTVFKFFVPVQA